jgi:hypothetical protein
MCCWASPVTVTLLLLLVLQLFLLSLLGLAKALAASQCGPLHCHRYYWHHSDYQLAAVRLYLEMREPSVCAMLSCD